MKAVSTQQAREHLAPLLEDVLRGERVQITRYGRPLAVLVSVDWYKRAKGCLGEPVPEFIPVPDTKTGEK